MLPTEMRVLDSEKSVKKMIRALDWPEYCDPDSVAAHQADSTNQRRVFVEDQQGLRTIILRRNKLGDGFAQCLARTLIHDNYLKKLDLVSNKITEHGFSLILKNALLDNFSLVNLDCRINPGCS
jgi:hypothetical protein